MPRSATAPARRATSPSCSAPAVGQLADAVTDATIIPYGEIDGFPVSTAPGHKGRLVIGTLFSRRVGDDAGPAASL